MEQSTPSRAALIVSALFLGGLLSGAWAGSAAASRAQDPYADLELLAEVLTTIETDYVEERPSQRLVYAAIRGMVHDLDEHSRWMSPDELAAFRDDTDGSYEGIGVQVRVVPDGVRISRVLAGGPAERDGLRVDDVILTVDGESLAGLTLDDVALRLKGPRGSSLLLGIRRPGVEGELTVATIRDRIDTPSVQSERLADGVGYVRLHQFQTGAARDLADGVERMQAESPLRALVLDLRENPGGLLDEAVAVTDLFLDAGPIVSTRGRLEGTIVHDATPGGFDPALKVVVLVNGMSASASEIVAGALQDTHRATLVGTHTYGKGSVQVMYEHDGETALKLTIGRYYTPSGAWVAPDEGRVPDVVVEMPVPSDPYTALHHALETSTDPHKDAMLALLDEIEAPERDVAPVPWEGTVEERAAVDPQLAKALEIARQ